MPRSRILGIYTLLFIFALSAGMLVARFFASTAPVPSGYVAPATDASLVATAAPEPTSALRVQAAPTAPEPTQAAISTASGDSTATPIPSAGLPSATPEPTVAPAASPTKQPTPTPGADHVEYTVQKGDTLKSIAEKYRVTVREILALNQIPNPDSLVVGSVVRIPKAQ